jgi:hypothetical protein
VSTPLILRQIYSVPWLGCSTLEGNIEKSIYSLMVMRKKKVLMLLNYRKIIWQLLLVMLRWIKKETKLQLKCRKTISFIFIGEPSYYKELNSSLISLIPTFLESY